MIAKVGGGIAAAVILMMIGCSTVASTILGVGDAATRSSTSSCLTVLGHKRTQDDQLMDLYVG